MNKCKACTQTDLTFYDSCDSPELKLRVKQIKGTGDIWTRLAAAGLLAGVVLIITYGLSSAMHIEKVKNPPLQTAAGSGAIPK